MLPACSTDHSRPPCTRSRVRVGEWKVGKWGSKLSYQEVRIMLVYIEVLQKCYRLEWKNNLFGGFNLETKDWLYCM